MKRGQIALGLALLALGGCATIENGTRQDIAVDTSPQGGSCKVSRAGRQVATVGAPGIVNVSRGKEALTFACSQAPDHESETTVTVKSTLNGATFGKLLTGAVIGVVVDSSTGASYSYPDKVVVELTGAGASATSVATTAPSVQAKAAPASLQSTPQAQSLQATPAAN